MIPLVGDNMIIDLSKIDEKGMDIDTYFDFKEEYIEKTSIEQLDHVHVVGKIYYDVTNEIIMDAKVDGTMVLLDVIDLEPVDYPFHIEIHEVLDENNEDLEEYLQLKKNVEFGDA